jgi:lantibiotic transport system permease protein
MATFIATTQSEFIKIKRTAAFWLTVIGAAFIPMINLLRLVFKADHFAPVMQKDPWGIIIMDNWKASTLFLLPMFVILITSLVVQIEFRNNTWKQVYASPRSYADIFFSKFLVIHVLLLFCFVLFNLFIILFSCVANLIKPQYGFFDHAVPWRLMLEVMGNIYFSVIAITAIQYWLSLRFRNFIAPVGIGLALVITGLIIHQWDQLYYYPYMYPAIAYWPEFHRSQEFYHKAELFDGIWFVAMLLLAFGDTLWRKERG